MAKVLSQKINFNQNLKTKDMRHLRLLFIAILVSALYSCSDDNMESVTTTVAPTTGKVAPAQPAPDATVTDSTGTDVNYSLLLACDSVQEVAYRNLDGRTFRRNDFMLPNSDTLIISGIEFKGSQLFNTVGYLVACDGEYSVYSQATAMDYKLVGAQLQVSAKGTNEFYTWGTIDCLNRSVLSLSGAGSKVLQFYDAADVALAGVSFCDLEKE